MNRSFAERSEANSRNGCGVISPKVVLQQVLYHGAQINKPIASVRVQLAFATDNITQSIKSLKMDSSDNGRVIGDNL